ncbi:CLUMA_CG013626, isoform A [Clunio marinus]|uniref:CLUMA_CG013626, isoform A n=1 Tax=Clunio marinus TaxID=568069 RepID=A0A1J1IPD1_9DIPT|nr:CLUMA_CG013626, isoform A [Clunio marinus]
MIFEEKSNLPPSYDDVFGAPAPSAPISEHQNQQPMNPGWHPNITQQHIASPPFINQQPAIVQQIPVQHTVIVINQPQVISPHPMHLTCPHCHQQTMTKTNSKNGCLTHLAAIFFCICWCPFVFLPYCFDCCKDVEHKCSICNGYIGTFKRFGKSENINTTMEHPSALMFGEQSGMLQYPHAPMNPPPPYTPHNMNPAFPTIVQQPMIYQQPMMVTAAQAPVLIINQQPLYGAYPTNLTCHHCREHITTKITRKIGCGNHSAAFLLCVFGCFPCAILPYFLCDSLYDVEHKCPKCEGYIGTHSRVGNQPYYEPGYGPNLFEGEEMGKQEQINITENPSASTFNQPLAPLNMQQPATNPQYQPQYPQQGGINPAFPPVVQQPLMQQQPVIVAAAPAPLLVVSQQPLYGAHPANVTCPHCNQPVTTKISYKIGCGNHLAAGVLCICGLFPCAILPYLFCDSLSNVIHNCPKCDGYIGTYTREGSYNRRYYDDGYHGRRRYDHHHRGPGISINM